MYIYTYMNTNIRDALRVAGARLSGDQLSEAARRPRGHEDIHMSK